MKTVGTVVEAFGLDIGGLEGSKGCYVRPSETRSYELGGSGAELTLLSSRLGLNGYDNAHNVSISLETTGTAPPSSTR